MNLKTTSRNLLSLLGNILLVYVAYTVCRLLFVWNNDALFHDITWPHLFELLKAGLIFDSSAICYTNSIIIIMFLLPFHWKEHKAFYSVGRWIYVIVNALCIAMNLCDIVYFPFTGKRTTASVVQEFGNEGAGQLTNIFVEHALSNWWLVVAFTLLVAMLWYGFRYPCEGKKKNRQIQYVTHSRRAEWARGMAIYYIVQSAILCLVTGLCIGLMRGGFTTAVRPITISNANKYVDNPSEAGIVLNTPFALIRTFDKQPMVVPDYMDTKEAAKLYSMEKYPSQANRSLNPLAGKLAAYADSIKMNVVVLIIESFSKQHIGFYNIQHDENGATGDKHTFTPFLDSLLNQSLTFRYSYSNGRKSIDGMPSILSSIPNFVEPFFLTPASMNKLSGLARELSENKGYTSAFFHGAENGSMGFEAFAKSTGFEKYYGRTEYNQDSRYNGDDDFDGTWAIWDEPFLQFYCDKMSEMKEPFMTSVFTASSHSPFKIPEEYKGKFPKGKSVLQECVAYTDHALRQFFNKARKQKWFERTLFVITSDHTSEHFDPYYATIPGNYCVPIAFYAPGIPELKGYNATTIVEQIDIMPTALSIIGYDKPYVAFGQDIITTPKDEKFAIHWIPEASIYEIIKGKYAIQFDGEEVTGVYNFKTDQKQKKNMVKSLPADSIEDHVKLMKSFIQQYMQRMNENNLVMKTDKQSGQ